MNTEKSVFALASSVKHADRIVNRLQEAGFRSDEISVLLPDQQGFTRANEYQETPELRTKPRGTLGTEKHTKAPEGGVTGATLGGVIGGSLGLLAGIGSLAIPGLGPFIAAGPIVAALSGSGIGGALGLLVGTLIGYGIPEYEAKKYENGLKEGGILLCVHAKDQAHVDLAKNVFEKEQARDIATSRERAKH